MSEKHATQPPSALTDDQQFFRDQMYQLLGWGFALILLEATVIVNDENHFNMVGKGPAGQVQPLHPDKAAKVIRQTKIVVFFIVVLTAGWAARAVSTRCRLPKHPTIPGWTETMVGVVLVILIQSFIIREISGVGWEALIPTFFNVAGPSS